MPLPSSHLRLVTSLVVSLMVLAGPARGQTPEGGIAIDRHDPAEAGGDWFGAESLDLRQGGRFAVGVLGSYARKPLVFSYPDGQPDVAPVREQLLLHFGAALNLAGRARVALNLPVVAFSNGTSALLGGRSYGVKDGAAVGDVRIGFDLRLLGVYGDPFLLALGLQVYLPTGDREAYASDGRARFVPRVLLAGHAGVFAWAARLGVDAHLRQQNFAEQPIGTELEAGLAAGLRLADGAVVIGPELQTSTVLGDDAAFKKRYMPLELWLGAHFTIADSLRVGLGGGPGINSALGTPEYRVLATLGYQHPFGEAPAPRAFDLPASPPAPVVVYTPLPPATPTPLPRPAPARPLPPPTPADADGDGLPDTIDACPDRAGERDPDVGRNGCPKVVLEDKEIRLFERIDFEPNQATLKPESLPVMEGVLRVLKSHPEIRVLRIEGHTDSRGAEDANFQLSQRRAVAVAVWLIGKGIPSGRLNPRGFGETRPIDNNRTEAGRRNNRRVQLVIEERGPATAPPAGVK